MINEKIEKYVQECPGEILDKITELTAALCVRKICDEFFQNGCDVAWTEDGEEECFSPEDERAQEKLYAEAVDWLGFGFSPSIVCDNLRSYADCHGNKFLEQRKYEALHRFIVASDRMKAKE